MKLTYPVKYPRGQRSYVATVPAGAAHGVPRQFSDHLVTRHSEVTPPKGVTHVAILGTEQ